VVGGAQGVSEAATQGCRAAGQAGQQAWPVLLMQHGAAVCGPVADLQDGRGRQHSRSAVVSGCIAVVWERGLQRVGWNAYTTLRPG
jgi:hypothetical protein